MYAPKDDLKHRANWRELYNKDEANHLRSLIEEAGRYNIDFYYSLAPGLDMVYSNSKDVACLVRKFDQLVELGCTSFALLFDDIEPTNNNDDKEVFKTYATAQVSITNLIYQHLGEPKFLFCPTEYCESRAVPNVPESEYLNTIGKELKPDIDIMWSGSRVISKVITEDSIMILTRVIRRPPLIWENLHANDYDKKRMFLGPYCGRSTKLIPKLRGVLTNPNCEYEANYIPIHTFARWSKCSEDAKPKTENSCDLLGLNINIQDQSCMQYLNDDVESNTNQMSCVYDPKLALEEAIKDWLPIFAECKESPASERLGECRQSENVALSAAMNLFQKEEPMVAEAMVEEESACSSDHIRIDSSDESLFDICKTSLSQPNMDHERMHSEPPYESSKDSEPMEFNNTNVRDQTQISENCPLCISSQRISDDSEKLKQLSSNHLALLVDLFYLPFEHGARGLQLLREFQWLRANCDLLSSNTGGESNEADNSKCIEPSNETTSLSDEDSSRKHSEARTPEIWFDHARNFENLSASIAELLYRLTSECRNKSLLHDIYPYLLEVRDITSLLSNYVKCVGKYQHFYCIILFISKYMVSK